jgi:hypothetical protein
MCLPRRSGEVGCLVSESHGHRERWYGGEAYEWMICSGHDRDQVGDLKAVLRIFFCGRIGVWSEEEDSEVEEPASSTTTGSLMLGSAKMKR